MASRAVPINSQARTPAASASTVAARTRASPSSAVCVVTILNCAACSVAVRQGEPLSRSGYYRAAGRAQLLLTPAVARASMTLCVAWACNVTASRVACMKASRSCAAASELAATIVALAHPPDPRGSRAGSDQP